MLHAACTYTQKAVATVLKGPACMGTVGITLRERYSSASNITNELKEPLTAAKVACSVPAMSACDTALTVCDWRCPSLKGCCLRREAGRRRGASSAGPRIARVASIYLRACATGLSTSVARSRHSREQARKGVFGVRRDRFKKRLCNVAINVTDWLILGAVSAFLSIHSTRTGTLKGDSRSLVLPTSELCTAVQRWLGSAGQPPLSSTPR